LRNRLSGPEASGRKHLAHPGKPSIRQIASALRELIDTGQVVREGHLVSPNKLAAQKILCRQLGMHEDCEMNQRMIRRAAELLVDEGFLVSERNRRAGLRVVKKRQGYIALVSSGTRLDFMGRVIEGIDQALEEHNSVNPGEAFRLICALSQRENRSEEKEERVVRELRPITDGLIILPVRSGDRSGDIANYVTTGFPIVLLGRRWITAEEEGRSDAPIVAYNEARIAKTIVEKTKPLVDRYIFNKPHFGRIFVAGEKNIRTLFVRQQQILGRLHETHNAKQNLRITPAYSDETRQEAGKDIAQQIAPDIQKGVTKTLVICTTDLVALGLITQLQRLKFHVPNEVLVTGVDGDEFSKHIYPTLTTLKLDPTFVGVQAAKLLLSRILDPGAPFTDKLIDGTNWQWQGGQSTKEQGDDECEAPESAATPER
jgi:DNA-binding LacI/PurR family transcriptional regulator